MDRLLALRTLRFSSPAMSRIAAALRDLAPPEPEAAVPPNSRGPKAHAKAVLNLLVLE